MAIEQYVQAIPRHRDLYSLYRLYRYLGLSRAEAIREALALISAIPRPADGLDRIPLLNAPW